MECLLGGTQVSKEELAELREIIESHVKEAGREKDEDAAGTHRKQPKPDAKGGAE